MMLSLLELRRVQRRVALSVIRWINVGSAGKFLCSQERFVSYQQISDSCTLPFIPICSSTRQTKTSSSSVLARTTKVSVVVKKLTVATLLPGFMRHYATE